MLFLGIDPGSRNTGYGLVEQQGDRLRATDRGCLRSPSGLPLADRLARLADGLAAVVAAARPDIAALESPFHGSNSRSLIVLAQARGVLLATLAGRGVPVVEYAPAQVKTAVTGNGRADKRQVARMVQMLLDLNDPTLSADTTDALAVAICAAHRYRLDRLAGAVAGSRRDGRS
ncbi:MAG: crossover junction endodeoxyribonuclease RuvC [Thermoanaerobaculia bacterium]